jgi:hypothetical protein
VSKPIDLPRVRAALRRLDTLAAEHPEAFTGRTPAQWITTLEESDTMNATVTKGRPVEGAEHTTQVAIRLPESMIAALDSYAQANARPGQAVTRSDAVRMLLLRGLDSLGRCGAVKGALVCTMHTGHKRTHYDSTADKSWK